MKIKIASSLLLLCAVTASAVGADSTESARVLLGTWSGKANGPDGGPPTGDITVTFSRGEKNQLKGKIQVKTPNGVEYSGEVSEIALLKRVFSANVTFKLGETPTVAAVTGPLAGRKISGTFSVTTNGQKMGDGTFSVTKEPATAHPAK